MALGTDQIKILMQNARQILGIAAAAFGGEPFNEKPTPEQCTGGAAGSQMQRIACGWHQIQADLATIEQHEFPQEWLDQVFQVGLLRAPFFAWLLTTTTIAVAPGSAGLHQQHGEQLRHDETGIRCPGVSCSIVVSHVRPVFSWNCRCEVAVAPDVLDGRLRNHDVRQQLRGGRASLLVLGHVGLDGIVGRPAQRQLARSRSSIHADAARTRHDGNAAHSGLESDRPKIRRRTRHCQDVHCDKSVSSLDPRFPDVRGHGTGGHAQEARKHSSLGHAVPIFYRRRARHLVQNVFHQRRCTGTDDRAGGRHDQPLVGIWCIACLPSPSCFRRRRNPGGLCPLSWTAWRKSNPRRVR